MTCPIPPHVFPGMHHTCMIERCGTAFIIWTCLLWAKWIQITPASPNTNKENWASHGAGPRLQQCLFCLVESATRSGPESSWKGLSSEQEDFLAWDKRQASWSRKQVRSPGARVQLLNCKPDWFRQVDLECSQGLGDLAPAHLPPDQPQLLPQTLTAPLA